MVVEDVRHRRRQVAVVLRARLLVGVLEQEELELGAEHRRVPELRRALDLALQHLSRRGSDRRPVGPFDVAEHERRPFEPRDAPQRGHVRPRREVAVAALPARHLVTRERGRPPSRARAGSCSPPSRGRRCLLRESSRPWRRLPMSRPCMSVNATTIGVDRAVRDGLLELLGAEHGKAYASTRRTKSGSRPAMISSAAPSRSGPKRAGDRDAAQPRCLGGGDPDVGILDGHGSSAAIPSSSSARRYPSGAGFPCSTSSAATRPERHRASPRPRAPSPPRPGPSPKRRPPVRARQPPQRPRAPRGSRSPRLLPAHGRARSCARPRRRGPARATARRSPGPRARPAARSTPRSRAASRARRTAPGRSRTGAPRRPRSCR